MEYISHNNINKQKWDDCVTRASNGIIYAYSLYLDIVSPRWDALIIGDYETIMPITHKKRFTIQYLCQPKLTQQLGVFSSSDINQNIVNKFLYSIPEKYKLIELNLNINNDANEPSFQYKKNITCHLKLDTNYEEIYKQYSEQIKRNIKKAIKNNITINYDANPDTIIELFKANKAKEIDAFDEQDYIVLKQIIKHQSNTNKTYIIAAKDANKNTIAGAFFIEALGKVIFLFSATNDEAKKQGAMSYLIDTFIKDKAGNNLILDFEGSNNKQLARFYQSFGSKPVEYLSIKRNNLPAIIKWLK